MVDDTPKGATIVTRAAAGAETADGASDFVATQGVGDSPEGTTIIPSWGQTTYASLPDPGYQVGELIGRGGMGEVVVAQDLRIQREVAVKRIRSKAPSHDAVERFLREARIQARLDHPAIVPVYELGTDEDGLPYFTMKRLTGETMYKRLADGGPVQPLLNAFVNVCMAIQLAHERGVIHRDLKPSNIMLGDYGEVYVLDWGVARVTSDRTRTTNSQMAIVEHEHDAMEDGTTSGAILGTPGYMAPEQIRGHELGPAADIYALGSILFEILSGECLHPRGETALATTLTRPQAAPSSRSRKAVPLELDGVCFDALAEDPDKRPSARQLATRIQAYLDGDRDLERRRGMAAEQLDSAQQAIEEGGVDAMATAMRRAGRALALDPTNEAAAALVTTLMLKPPEAKDYPKELVQRMEDEARSVNKERSKRALISYVTIFVLFCAVTPWLAIKNWTLYACFIGNMAVLCLIVLEGMRSGKTPLVPAFIANLCGVIMFSRMLGPYMLTPIVTIGILLSFTASPRLLARPMWIWIWVGLAVGIPIGLDLLDVMPSTTYAAAGKVLVGSDYFILGNLTMVLLCFAQVGFMFIMIRFMLATSRRREQTRIKAQVQAWHLEQMLPKQNKPWATRPRQSFPVIEKV
ncbi:MAG: serine/threonine-protein kinase [Kofleriaceae bacterium]